LKTTAKNAITLVEMMITVALTAIISISAFTLYRGGLQSSLSGVVNLDMLNEGRKVIAQIHTDLKHAGIPYHGAFSLSFNDLLQVDFSKNRGLEGAEFSLLRFKNDPEFVRNDLPAQDYLLRPLISVKYRLEKVNNSDLLRLVREVNQNPNHPGSRVLSERVSFFRIAPVQISTPGSVDAWFWNISLQLSQRSDTANGKEPEKPEKTRGEGSLDFYDVVYSEFFNAVNNYRHSPRNWNTGLKYTPD